jgi:hypothetical protein
VGRVKQNFLKMKRIMFTAFAVGLGLTANVMAQVPSYVPTNGLVGWWPFNGNANDESGNGNNGTVNGATLTNDRFGVANKAYSFNNANITKSNFQINFNEISVAFWLKNNNITDIQRIVTHQWPSGSFSTHIVNDPGGNTPFYLGGIIMNPSNQQYSTANPSPAYLNTWTHFILTNNNNSQKLYINGVLVDVSISSILKQTTGTLYFGGDALKYYGSLDDIGIWNRALTECEIADLYNSQLGSFSNSNISTNPSFSVIGSNATLTVSTPIQNVQWQSNPSNIGWVNLSNNANYNGVNNDTLIVSNLQLSNHNQPFRALACGDTSNIANIQITDTCIINVTVYDTLLTTVTDTLIINTTLSLPAPNNENTILIYPNPASDHVTIDNGNFAAMAGYSIKIENNAGQQVFQSAINQAQFYVDLSTWTGNGLYFVHLIDPQNNTVTVRKIVLQ